MATFKKVQISMADDMLEYIDQQISKLHTSRSGYLSNLVNEKRFAVDTMTTLQQMVEHLKQQQLIGKDKE